LEEKVEGPILLATHGTENAVRAEDEAFELSRQLGLPVTALYVVHENWAKVIGADWLTSYSTRRTFIRHAESELKKRADAVLDAAAAKGRGAGIEVRRVIRIGEPGQAIGDEAREMKAGLIVMGGRARKRSKEFKARIKMDRFLREAPCPVLVIP
jgi:nucleotide-binding universal stress UspA family protein